MTFPEGWLQQQINTAKQTINEWPEVKREVMLKEDAEDVFPEEATRDIVVNE
ncbi:MAG: hypothetical protein RQ754_15705 [Desulfuromonadales bacterium]|nr:hypothetical protein [Desulfuromonadales bacterium]